MNTEIKYSLFEQLEKIGEAHKGSDALHDSDFAEFYEMLREPVDAACVRLHITPLQTVLFADILCVLSGREIGFEEIARHIGCAVREIYKYSPEIEALEEHDLAKCIGFRAG